MATIRKPSVASLFYPDEKIGLKRMINNFLANVPAEIQQSFVKVNADPFLGIIVPHAGYLYSGQVAAFAYTLLKDKSPDTVVLIGPSHYNYFEGLALSSADGFETPFGVIPIDKDLSNRLISDEKGLFDYVDSAHEKEHSIEVQLPFLQNTLINNFKILPILIAEQKGSSVSDAAEVFAKILQERNKNILFVISSDLSHYHNDSVAREMDKKLIQAIKEMDTQKIITGISQGEMEACGALPICLFLEIAKKTERKNIKDLVYQNSGKVSGDYSKVVGYFSAVIW